MSESTTGRDSPQFLLRLPEALRDRVKEAARENKRSMNAEIVSRLENTFLGTTSEESYISPNDEKELIAHIDNIVREQVRITTAQTSIDLLGILQDVKKEGAEISDSLLQRLMTHFLGRKDVPLSDPAEFEPSLRSTNPHIAPTPSPPVKIRTRGKPKG